VTTTLLKPLGERRTAATGASASAAGRDALIDGLNHDLAGEYQAILMYTLYAAKITGPHRPGLRALFQAEIADEQAHAQFLADKVAALGGEPAAVPRPVPCADGPRQMLENVLAAEVRAVAGYVARVRQAEARGDIGLKVALENQIADETRHKEEVERILAGWDDANLERARDEDRWQAEGSPD
jgi:bacterioferritin